MIKYHGTPISGNNIEIARFLAGRHALVSFANQQDIAIVAHVCESFILDNGAFTFWKISEKLRKEGKIPTPPDWNKYIAWVYEWYRHPAFDWWLIPDVIDGTEEDNRELMQEFGNSVPGGVPVFHLHESLDHLRWLMGNFERIALGSSGKWSTPDTPEWWQRMSELMGVICDPNGMPNRKLHGLRMLNTDVFIKLPLASADSCNVGMNCGNSDRWHGSYKPPRSSQRAEVIAWRIEGCQSPRQWGTTWAEE